jgi:hypothetical protein
LSTGETGLKNNNERIREALVCIRQESVYVKVKVRAPQIFLKNKSTSSLVRTRCFAKQTWFELAGYGR